MFFIYSVDYLLPREEQIEVFEALERAGTKIWEEESDLEKRVEKAVSSLGVQTQLILGLSSGGALLLQLNVACGSGLLFFVLSSMSVMAGFGLSILVALRKIGQLKRPLQQLRCRRVQLGRELRMLIAIVPIVDEHVHLPQCLANESDNDDLEAGQLRTCYDSHSIMDGQLRT